MTKASPFRYVKAHWIGEQSLQWSFWINLVVLRLAIVLGQIALTTYAPATLSSHPLVVLGIGVFFHGAVFVWQVVGVLRSGEAHIGAMGSITNMWGAQLGILIAVWVVLSESWGLWLASHPAAPEEGLALHIDPGLAGQFDLTLSDNGESAVFIGDIVRGSTKSVAAFLTENPNVMRIVLTSNGGNIYEARGLARLAREHGLGTYVDNYCSSACTLAFIGGTTRRLAPGAKLGFHQYRINASYEIPFANPKAEEAKDRALYDQAGVSRWFLEQMYLTESNDMWFPTADELQNAGVTNAD